jgi:hypothetical protein
VRASFLALRPLPAVARLSLPSAVELLGCAVEPIDESESSTLTESIGGLVVSSTRTGSAEITTVISDEDRTQALSDHCGAKLEPLSS